MTEKLPTGIVTQHHFLENQLTDLQGTTISFQVFKFIYFQVVLS